MTAANFGSQIPSNVGMNGICLTNAAVLFSYLGGPFLMHSRCVWGEIIVCVEQLKVQVRLAQVCKVFVSFVFITTDPIIEGIVH